jgi:bifunctional non-homologous end joining protein LigD
MGLEGIVGKRADSRYVGKRTSDWRKVRGERTGDFVVVGFTHPESSARVGFGALHLAVLRGDEWSYAGRVGTGFDDKLLSSLRARLDALAVDAPPCTGPLVPKGKGHTWVRPEVVVEVAYLEWTDERSLRHPVFQRVRDDKRAEECTAPGTEEAAPAPAAEEAPDVDVDPPRVGVVVEKKVPFSNLTKVFWPQDGITKGDLIEYYRAIAPWLLPYLQDRPVVLTRYPDGIEGKSFFQKDAPPFVPSWLRTTRMWSEQAAREIDAFVVEDTESLLYLANLGTIPLHIWSSRIATLQRPDWTSLDLDPKSAPFSDVVVLAKAIRALCERIGLPCFAKTTGSSGIHVLVPLGGRLTHDQAKSLGELLARVVVTEHPDIATIERVVEKRGGKVYVDFLQNGHGRLLAAPFCARPLPGAPVSMPLRWSEVNGKLTPRRFTLKDAPARMKKLKVDPNVAVLTEAPDLARALSALSALV